MAVGMLPRPACSPPWLNPFSGGATAILLCRPWVEEGGNWRNNYPFVAFRGVRVTGPLLESVKTLVAVESELLEPTKCSIHARHLGRTNPLVQLIRASVESVRKETDYRLDVVERCLQIGDRVRKCGVADATRDIAPKLRNLWRDVLKRASPRRPTHSGWIGLIQGIASDVGIWLSRRRSRRI